MGLLGFMAAGGAQGYANAKNAQTEANNKVQSAVILQELQNDFEQRLAERKAVADRQNAIFQHGLNVDKENAKFENQKTLQTQKDSAAKERAELIQGRADARTRANIASRKEVALLNTSKKSSGSSGQFSVKDLIKANDSDEKEMHQIRMQLNDPLIVQKDQMTKGAKTSDILKQRLDELQMKVLDRQRMIDANGTPSGDDAGFAELANILKQ